MLVRLQVLFLISLISCTYADYCHGSPGIYYVNNQPIWRQQPRLIKKHKYGELFEIGTGTTTIKLLHVYGNMYQMGFAHGQLLRQQLNNFFDQLWKYIEQQFEQLIPKYIPLFLQKGLTNLVASTALDLTYQITRSFTNKRYYEELKGIADGSGISFKFFRRVHMIGQLTKGSCSMFGAWGKATSGGQTIQLRALDWDFNGPYKKYPMAVVYHPVKPKDGNIWMNIGFIGWVGILSGVNQHKMGVSEIGVYFKDQTFGKESRIGNPFTFLLRDILQFDKDINSSIQRLTKARRTCNLILGVGDGKAGYFRGFQVSHSVCNVVDDTHPLPHNDTWHPGLENVVYWGMDWNCPNYHIRFHQMLSKYYGKITVQTTIKYIVPGLNSGNLQVVVYDLSNQWVYFAYGYQEDNGKKIDAFNRPYIGINLKEEFGRKKM